MKSLRNCTRLIANEFDKHEIDYRIITHELYSELQSTIMIRQGAMFTISYISFDEDEVIILIKGLPTNISNDKVEIFEKLCDFVNAFPINRGSLSYCLINDSDIALVPWSFPQKIQNIAVEAVALLVGVSLSLQLCYPLISELMYADATDEYADISDKMNDNEEDEKKASLIADLSFLTMDLCDIYEGIKGDCTHSASDSTACTNDFDEGLIIDLLKKPMSRYKS